ncbi:ABC transporter permease [Jiella avicenniae]|uniref:ABC transporter permease n=1 Tax=Jiella avicenniae TaxID=2907202 RepID=A0A9X1T6A2_9HYPH|nr:ABC transporter permease [Jiella avicenniae]MCE7029140.1 ABC transporter permease [Jiella avicenniae]
MMMLAAPVIAVALTLLVGAVLFTLLGHDGFGAILEIFVRPLFNPYRWQDLLVKAAPLAIIAIGLAIGFRANVWNIGAEGQYILGGLAGTGIALATLDMAGPWILPLMLVFGILGGMAWAAIPALLRTTLGVNEILSSLMLNYVAIQLLYFLMRGPWMDPEGFNFPQTAMFSADQTLPMVVPGTLIHLGVPLAAAVALTAFAVMARTVTGFQMKVVGLAPKAAAFGGFGAASTVWIALMAGGGLAGFAGILEAAGPFGQMVPQFPTGYGYTAIIVAFLGRLNPLGILLAAMVLALTYVGGESAQTTIGLPAAATGVFQAMMLFFLLATDILVRYRLVSGRAAPAGVPAGKSEGEAAPSGKGKAVAA